MATSALAQGLEVDLVRRGGRRSARPARGPSRWRRARTGATMTVGGVGRARALPAQHAASAHRLDLRADPLEGQGLPGRQSDGPARAGAPDSSGARRPEEAGRDRRPARSASSPVAVTTSRRRRSVTAASAARATAWPRSRTRPGWHRRTPGHTAWPRRGPAPGCRGRRAAQPTGVRAVPMARSIALGGEAARSASAARSRATDSGVSASALRGPG